MSAKPASLTALGIALVRALESEKPEGERICYDPYAYRFVNPWLLRVGRWLERLGWSERRGPGVMGFLVARERHIDEFLQQQLKAHLQQLVILGAGYDTRAYRFAPQLHGTVKVFEADHPATQQAKLLQLQKIFGHVPEHVGYVPVDFNTQTLSQRLRAGGYASRLRTLFIWQGVTPYLTAEAVDATLAFVAQQTAPGSAIIFDYIDQAVVEGKQPHGEIRHMRRAPGLSREAIIFGIPPATIESFLTTRGFTQIRNASAQALHAAYFTGVNQKRTVVDGYAIVSAVVPGN